MSEWSDDDRNMTSHSNLKLGFFETPWDVNRVYLFNNE